MGSLARSHSHSLNSSGPSSRMSSSSTICEDADVHTELPTKSSGPKMSHRRDKAEPKALAEDSVDHAGIEPNAILPVKPPDSVSAVAHGATSAPERSPLAGFSKTKRWFLLMIFCLSVFLDVSCRSGVVLFTEQIATDLDIVYTSSTWILTSFSVPFACFLLFWGRVADLFSPKLVFVGGFTCLGVSCTIVSVCPEMISFFVFRGLCGLFCSATIPAAFRLIMMVFEGKERGTAITVFSLSGAVANAAGLVLAAFFGFIADGGEMSSWRWYFRFIALLSLPFATISYLCIPATHSSSKHTTREKWRRFDLPGCAMMLTATLLFILSLTLGATYGWKTPKFLVPFLLCWPVGVGFFLWEKRLPEGCALIPPSTWGIRNLTLLLVISISAFAYWPSTQLPLVERWEGVYGMAPIIVAVKMVPQGVASVIPVFILPHVPERWKASRWYIVITYSIIASMLLPLIYSHGDLQGTGYFRFAFWSFIIASFFGAAAFSGISVSVMVSVPSDMAGVAGALLQVFLQIGGAAVFTIQAGLLTIFPGSYGNFHNLQASWWFFGGWYMVNVIAVAVMFKDPKKAERDDAAGTGEERKGSVRGVVGEKIEEVEGRESTGTDGRALKPTMTRVQSLV